MKTMIAALVGVVLGAAVLHAGTQITFDIIERLAATDDDVFDEDEDEDNFQGGFSG